MRIIEGHAYDVHGSVPPESEGNPNKWRANISLVVIAPSIQAAVMLALEARPQLKIENVKHRGDRVVIVGDKTAPITPR